MKSLLLLLFLLVVGTLPPSSAPLFGQGNPWRKRLQPPEQFDIDFRPGQNLVSPPEGNPAERPEDDGITRAYHILGMPLNAFLQAMAQRAGANYIPTPDVQGMVNSVFFDLDPVSMAKAGARVNGYALDSLDGVFVVRRLSPPGEAQPPPSAFSRRKSGPASSHPSRLLPTRPLTTLTVAPQEEESHPRPPRQQPVASDGPLRPPRKLPAAGRAAASAEDKKLIALTKKLARQKAEQKELLEQERQLHRRLRKEERVLEAERKATEKALRDQIIRAKKAAAAAQRLQAVE